jgi:hypothetical protein
MNAHNSETWQVEATIRIGTIEKVTRPVTKQPAWIYYTEDRTNCDIFSSYAVAVDYAERQFFRGKIEGIMSVDCD